MMAGGFAMVAAADVIVIGSDAVTPGEAASGVEVGSYIRSDQPSGSFSNSFLLIGELNANRGSMRGILSFDLSSIPPSASITSATVSLFQDQATTGRGGFRAVDIELRSMTGAITEGSSWSSSSNQFDAVLATVEGNTRTVTLNSEFAFSSVELAQYLQNSLNAGALHLGVMVPELEALSNLSTGEYFIFDGPNVEGYSGSTNSIAPSLRVEFETPGNEVSPDGGVMINEIHSDPDEPYELVEFVELFNSKDTAIDLSGWSLSRGVEFTFPDGTMIESGGYLVVTEDSSVRTISPTTTVQSKFGADPAAIFGVFGGGLKNEGETIELQNSHGVVVDRVDFGQGFPWPTMGEGNSMQLVRSDADNDLGGSWRGASPTPGSANAGVFAANLPPQVRQVKHTPEIPSSSDTVTVTAKITDADMMGTVELLYQEVEPGSYVRITDAAYHSWTTISMNDDGLSGDEIAGDSIFSARLPASIVEHRNLVRYRIRATDGRGGSVTVPYSDDPQPNFAMLVYDGIPSWSGANNPGGGDAVEPFSAEDMRSLTSYHLIADEEDVNRCQFNTSDTLTRFKGTLVYEGKVYDHIEFRIRGQGSTYVSGKNKWKFYFNRGHGLEARNDYGEKYAEPWRVMSCSAAAAPYNANHRGSVGIDEALAFRLFNLAGVPAPRTHYFQLRIIDDEGEASSSSQYEGDLWGVYLATEYPDGRFLKEHDLPDGNTYKMEGQGDKKHQGSTQSVNNADLIAFQNQYNQIQSESWWEANFDLDSYFGFRAVHHIVNNLDMADTRNFYWYHNAETGKWTAVPWDMDNAYLHANSEHVRLNVHRCLDLPGIKIAYDNRVRELQDLLFAREASSPLVDEIGSIISLPGASKTMVEMDQYMWNYHPRAGSVSGRVHRGAYFLSPAFRTTNLTPRYGRWLPTADFEGMKHFYKDFFAPRAGSVTVHNSTWEYWNGWETLESRISDTGVPATPVIQYVGGAGFPVTGLTFETSPFGDPGDPGGTFAAMKWRLAEVADFSPPMSGAELERAVPGKYEIEADWESDEIASFSNTITIPSEVVTVGRNYRVRCQMKDDSGRWSRWSDAVEFVAGSANVMPWLENLVVTEFMYHPAPPTGAEVAVSDDESDYEFIEIWNRSDTESLDLSGVFLSDGVEFSFANGGIASLGPDEYALVVKNRAAFEARYGTGLPVAGEYSGKLSNAGERVALTFSGGTVIREWSFIDSSPWPEAADGSGASLELQNPKGLQDHALAASWAASEADGGSPGEASGPPSGTFAAWQRLIFSVAELDDSLVSGAEADPDGDGRSNLMEWATATNALKKDQKSIKLIQVESGGDESMALQFNRPVGVTGLTYDLMASHDLSSWESVADIPVIEMVHGDGREQVRLEDVETIQGGLRTRFLRLRVTLQE